MGRADLIVKNSSIFICNVLNCHRSGNHCCQTFQSLHWRQCFLNLSEFLLTEDICLSRRMHLQVFQFTYILPLLILRPSVVETSGSVHTNSCCMFSKQCLDRFSFNCEPRGQCFGIPKTWIGDRKSSDPKSRAPTTRVAMACTEYVNHQRIC